MKNFLYDFFVWCAGSDRAVLDRCGQAEHIKHAGYGGLVVVPAILGGCSMTYALSTLTQIPFFYIGGGLVWAGIVLMFDRFILSTFRKSEKWWKDVFSITFFTRMLFAVGIGFIVSHPLVLLVFDDSLEQELTTMRIESENELRTSFEDKLNAIRSREDTLASQLNEKIEYRQCLERLILFEMSGKDTTLACGTSSGIQKYGPRATEIKEEIKGLNTDIELFRAQNKLISEKNQEELALLLGDRDKKLAEFTFSTNYLAREIALQRLESRKPSGDVVLWTKWFLILFFVFVDILPVTFKVVTKYGEYDKRLAEEDNFTIQVTHSYEREQHEKVRKHYTDHLLTHRNQQIEKNIQIASDSEENYESLLQKINPYLKY